ncbi:MAG TPA: RDD family protein [Candidatus Acidoferrum sp.]|nr:RDD family protein [Candidatus Acidoferrum sp.]
MFVEEKYQTFYQRFWAGIIDGLVFIPVDIVSYLAFSSANPKWVVIAWGVVYYTSRWIYSVGMHARYGMTVGKHSMDVIVLDVSEQRLPSLKQALLRDIFLIFSRLVLLFNFIRVVLASGYSEHIDKQLGWFGAALSWVGLVWFLLELVTMLSNNKRRALHDLIAGTVVVEESLETISVTAASR